MFTVIIYLLANRTSAFPVKPMDSSRRVYLPLQRLDKCAVCASAAGEGENAKLKLCSSCGEVRIPYRAQYICKLIFIFDRSASTVQELVSKRIGRSTRELAVRRRPSTTPVHHPDTLPGKTDRIDIDKFYPYLAFLAEMMHIKAPPRFALLGRLRNEGPPSQWPVITLPDGWTSCILHIDDTQGVSVEDDTQAWWPTAPSMEVAAKLGCRIMREGNVLPIVTAISLGILAEMYTTTSDSSSSTRRTRLRYRSSPIADFGVAKGSVKVIGEDKLTYLRRSDGAFIRGQDPNNHYWIYFTTVASTELILDFNMFTFNMCACVPSAPYVSPSQQKRSSMLPAWFEDRDVRLRTPQSLHTERKRWSVLRDPRTHQAVEHTLEGFHDADIAAMNAFMVEVLGRPPTSSEVDLACKWTMYACEQLGHNLSTGRWKTYLASPTVIPWADPGEMDGAEDFELPDPHEMKRLRRKAAKAARK